VLCCRKSPFAVRFSDVRRPMTDDLFLPCAVQFSRIASFIFPPLAGGNDYNIISGIHRQVLF
ncbi:MAG: hypothetical protein ACUVTU_13090, partial [Desulfurispora sp.]|uniref:hypothetical protein n=1 Tax=Desulfurispora sp. TaxID=3014275 RepID=UPI00404AB6ED